MNPNNTGSFGSAAGGVSPELQAAIQRRAGGNPSGPMGQVTQGAPTYNPSTQPSNSAPAPVQGNSGQGLSIPSTGTGAGLPNESSEAKIIISALRERLKSLSDIQKSGGQI
jgi:hypothetical protein